MSKYTDKELIEEVMNDSNGDDEDNGDAVLGPVFPETSIL